MSEYMNIGFRPYPDRTGLRPVSKEQQLYIDVEYEAGRARTLLMQERTRDLHEALKARKNASKPNPAPAL